MSDDTMPTTPSETPAEPRKKPADEVGRAKAAERSRKARALKKLKAAKSEGELKKLAAEVAQSTPEELAPVESSWPTKEEFAETAQQLSPAIEELAGLVADTPFALTERDAKILVLSLSPAIAQAAKDPRSSALSKYVSPGVVACIGLAAVFGPPLFREVRGLVRELKAEAPQKKTGDVVQLAPPPKTEGGAA